MYSTVSHWNRFLQDNAPIQQHVSRTIYFALLNCFTHAFDINLQASWLSSEHVGHNQCCAVMHHFPQSCWFRHFRVNMNQVFDLKTQVWKHIFQLLFSITCHPLKTSSTFTCTWFLNNLHYFDASKTQDSLR